eukprot:m.54657 g.54657  ORF g.54657 m.54657 type:complete len:832 (+) comp7545_c0_seq1:173-2668(+)
MPRKGLEARRNKSTPTDMSVNDETWDSTPHSSPGAEERTRLLDDLRSPEMLTTFAPPPRDEMEDSGTSKAREMLHRWMKKTPHPPREHVLKIQATFESLDYESTESEIERQDRIKYTEWDNKVRAIQRWIICAVIGFLTGLIAFIIDTCIINLAKWKFDTIQIYLDKCVQQDCLTTPLMVWLAIDLLFVGIATSFVTFGSPIAAGSGIPEVKCYLNGIKMPGVVRLKTLIAKTTGVMFSVAGGLFVGKEGPMIHSGAVVAAGVSQGKSTTMGWCDSGLFKRFRNDQEKRDFVSAGAAAGVAAAFGAPIGGVLFSLEEGSSWWNQGLTWRVFFAAMNASFWLNFLLSMFPKDGRMSPDTTLSNPGLLNFGKFSNMPYNSYEIPLFILVGVVGGLGGALFNHLNFRLTEFRMRYLHNKYHRAIEALTVGLVSVALCFGLMVISSDCLSLGDTPDMHALQLFCADHQYSAMASLLFNTPEAAIKNLFHENREEFRLETLALFGTLYFFVACWTYGIAVPSGLFVPCIVIGAAWGRLFGGILAEQYPDRAWADPGKYALIGAAAMLAGVVRMTISLTVIIIEATGNVTYGLPIMLAVIFAKWVGDYFNEGLYDIHIELKHIPLLGWNPPPMQRLVVADDIMSHKIIALYKDVRVGHLIEMMQRTKHQAFPIIEYDNTSKADHGLATLHGIILRHQLLMLLQFGAYGRHGDEHPRMTLDDFRKGYPRYPTLEDINVPTEHYHLWVNLRSYMNPSPYVVTQTSSLHRIFRLFRTMGLRHLAIVNDHHQLVGMITRKDLSNLKTESDKQSSDRRPLGLRTTYVTPKDEVHDRDRSVYE